MTILQQSLIALILAVLGGVKTWLHMGSISVLTLPLCSGNSVQISTGWDTLLLQSHCWGCYAFVAGLLLATHSAYRWSEQRRSVASGMD